jgi:hypothetical protein
VADAWAKSNQPFLGSVMTVAKGIDRLTRAIDARYRRVRTLKERINEALGRPARERVPEAAEDLAPL